MDSVVLLLLDFQDARRISDFSGSSAMMGNSNAKGNLDGKTLPKWKWLGTGGTSKRRDGQQRHDDDGTSYQCKQAIQVVQ